MRFVPEKVDIFRSKVLNHKLNEDYWTLKAKISPQSPRTALVEGFEGAAETAGNWAMVILIISILISVSSVGEKAGRTMTMFVRAL